MMLCACRCVLLQEGEEEEEVQQCTVPLARTKNRLTGRKQAPARVAASHADYLSMMRGPFHRRSSTGMRAG
jgi:alpha-D-ribose 1-methylphosphonate 5-triphosphate synthase subunit PhnG